MKKAICIIISTVVLTQACADKINQIMPQATTLTEQEQQTENESENKEEETSEGEQPQEEDKNEEPSGEPAAAKTQTFGRQTRDSVRHCASWLDQIEEQIEEEYEEQYINEFEYVNIQKYIIILAGETSEGDKEQPEEDKNEEPSGEPAAAKTQTFGRQTRDSVRHCASWLDQIEEQIEEEYEEQYINEFEYVNIQKYIIILVGETSEGDKEQPEEDKSEEPSGEPAAAKTQTFGRQIRDSVRHCASWLDQIEEQIEEEYEEQYINEFEYVNIQKYIIIPAPQTKSEDSKTSQTNPPVISKPPPPTISRVSTQARTGTPSTYADIPYKSGIIRTPRATNPQTRYELPAAASQTASAPQSASILILPGQIPAEESPLTKSQESEGKINKTKRPAGGGRRLLLPASEAVIAVSAVYGIARISIVLAKTASGKIHSWLITQLIEGDAELRDEVPLKDDPRRAELGYPLTAHGIGNKGGSSGNGGFAKVLRAKSLKRTAGTGAPARAERPLPPPYLPRLRSRFFYEVYDTEERTTRIYTMRGLFARDGLTYKIARTFQQNLIDNAEYLRRRYRFRDTLQPENINTRTVFTHIPTNTRHTLGYWFRQEGINPLNDNANCVQAEYRAEEIYGQAIPARELAEGQRYIIYDGTEGRFIESENPEGRETGRPLVQDWKTFIDVEGGIPEEGETLDYLFLMRNERLLDLKKYPYGTFPTHAEMIDILRQAEENNVIDLRFYAVKGIDGTADGRHEADETGGEGTEIPIVNLMPDCYYRICEISGERTPQIMTIYQFIRNGYGPDLNFRANIGRNMWDLRRHRFYETQQPCGIERISLWIPFRTNTLERWFLERINPAGDPEYESEEEPDAQPEHDTEEV